MSNKKKQLKKELEEVDKEMKKKMQEANKRGEKLDLTPSIPTTPEEIQRREKFIQIYGSEEQEEQQQEQKVQQEEQEADE